MLIDRLGPAMPNGPTAAAVAEAFDAFTAWAEEQGLELYAHQEDALLALAAGEHVVLGTPTGSGKSLVAAGALAFALARGRRGVYTAPVKALVSEKFFDLIGLFGAANVGLMTGDAAVNTDAPVICCTAEVLANQALRLGARTPFDVAVMDEFHFYGDPDRGWAWQVPLLEMPRTQFLAMSATLGNVENIVEDLRRRTGRPVAVIADAPRPVPLEFEYAVIPLPNLITGLVKGGLTPAYVVQFTQREAVELAGRLAALPLADKQRQADLRDGIGGFRFGPGFGGVLSKLLRKGVGVHHAGMLPMYRRLVERLASEGLLSVISGTDTLGVGINLPIKTVVLTSLVKFDGRRLRRINAREFHQIAGRAGRAGYDDSGHVIVQAPEDAIERAQAAAKAEARAQAGKKPAKTGSRTSDRGKISWSEDTFLKLVASAPEPLTPRLKVTHAMILELLAREDDPVAAGYRLFTDNHQPVRPRNLLIRQACRIYHSLKVAGVVTHTPGRVELALELPPDFALNQPLTPFALAACELLDPDSPTYELDLVSIFEATLEPPAPVLIAQEKAAKSQALAEMKADGWDYFDRMNALDQITYPKPLEEFLDAALAMYRRGHPWVDDSALTPKSIVREMREHAQTFAEFVSRHSLANAEGVLLRYLSDAYKALTKSAPTAARQRLVGITDWLGDIIRGVDSSLIEEWEELNALGRGLDAPA
jgi:superfamily II RNA helicase